MKYIYLLLALSALTLSACSSSGEYRQCVGSAWGTTYHIKYKSDRDLCDSIVAVMSAVDTSLSPFTKGSLISRINSGERVKADTMFCQVMRLSKLVHAMSHGAFDPTLAPLINLWGFGYTPGAVDRPTDEQIAAALGSVGIDRCDIDADGYVVRKSADTQFNFSAIAKGYGIDCIADMLRRNGCTDYMVEVGGEVALSGLSPSHALWRIQVDAPIVDDGAISHTALRVISVSDVCIATSGNYRNHRSTSAGDVGHTISPVTGMPVATRTLSATVTAPTTALADALATAAMAMPDTAALAMIDSIPGVEAMLVLGNPDGSYSIVKSEE